MLFHVTWYLVTHKRQNYDLHVTTYDPYQHRQCTHAAAGKRQVDGEINTKRRKKNNRSCLNPRTTHRHEKSLLHRYTMLHPSHGTATDDTRGVHGVGGGAGRGESDDEGREGLGGGRGGEAFDGSISNRDASK